MNKTFYEAWVDRLLAYVMKVNDYSKENDINENRVNLGCVLTAARVLEDIGHEVLMEAFRQTEEYDGYMRISKITLNGKIIYSKE